jgi:hypothetical protein
MIKLTIEGKKYEMASGWDEIYLTQFFEIYDIKDLEISELKKTLKIISVLSGIPMDILMTINIDDLQAIDMSWITKDIPKNVEKIIKIEGKEYGIVKDIKKLSLGEYADCDGYGKDIRNLHYISAILLRPVTDKDGEMYMIEKYDSNTLEERAKLFKEKLNIQQILGMNNFFLNSVNGSLKNLTNSSRKQAPKKEKK